MRRRTLPKAAALLAATTLMTTGCLSQSNSADSGGGGGSSKGNQSKTVEIMLGFTGDQLTQFKQTLEPYAKSKGITIKWSPTDNFNQLINTRVQGNSPPDIAMFPQPGILLDLANKGKLAPLDDFLDMGALQSSMTTGTLDAGSTGGHLFGLLASMNVKSLVFYPKKAFESAGYTAPKSIPELIDLTDRIKADGKTPWCLGIESGPATGWPATDWMEELVLKYGGIDQYNAWIKNEVKFDSPLVRKAADTFAKVAFTDGNVLGGRKSIAGNNFGTAGNPMFRDPPGCFLFKQGNFVAAKGFFPDKVVADIDNQVGVFAFPPATAGGDNPVEGGGDLMGLFSKGNKAAETIIKYVSTPQFGASDAKTGGFISPHKDFDVSNYPTQTIKDIAKIAYDTTAFGFDGSDAMPGAVGAGSFWKGMTAWISGGQSLDQALKAIDDSWPTS
jgi:alpha-glucoside transport system substrate-binding protein